MHSIFISGALVLSLLLPTTSSAAIRDGGKCSKINATTFIQGKNLTCTKIGNSKRWVAQLSSSYARGPGGRLVYRYVDGKQERLDAKNLWQKSDSRAASKFHATRVAAYKSMSAVPVDPAAKKITFDYIIQPSFPAEVANAIKKQSNDVATRLSGLLDKNLEIKLILVTEKDRDFIANTLNSYIPNPDWLGALSIINDYGTKEAFYSRSGTGGGTAFYLKDKNYGYYLGHTSSLATLETYWPEVAPHEMTHVIQGVLTSGVDMNGSQYPEGDPNARWNGHLIEGSANTLGMGWGFENLGWYSDEMDFLFCRDVNFFKSKVTMATSADAIKLIERIERRDNPINGSFAYSAGQILWEYYIGTYGAQKYFDLLTNLPNTENFNENLKKTIGLSRDQFYKAAAPYLLSHWKSCPPPTNN